MRVAGFVALVAAGITHHATGADAASTLLYIPGLLVLAFAEPWGACVIYALAAASLALGVDLTRHPGRAAFVHIYWTALTEWAVLALVACTASLLIRERGRVREAERAVQEKILELQDRQRRLEETLREVGRLQDDLARREHQARIGDAVFATAHDMERPLASAAVYVEELTRLVGRAQALKNPQVFLDELQPLLEKLDERIRSMDRILTEIRDLHKLRPRS